MDKGMLLPANRTRDRREAINRKEKASLSFPLQWLRI